MTTNGTESFDRPIGSAEQDLLGTQTYAKQLADYILTMGQNFTVGVYGQWGSGKTSFVHLVRTALGDTVRFIEFTAWPFRTSDELWRALILRISGELYDRPVESWPPAPRPSRPFALRYRAFLNRTVFGSSSDESVAHTFASYENLVAALDANLVNSIRKSPFGTFSDEEQAALAVAKVVAATVSAVSPFGDALRVLLGLDDQKAAEDKQSNAQTRSRIESITKFQGLLRELFKRKAKNQRVCVFVDDLDRCMPDVALDLLEAIQIFLGNVNCVFIVAADQELIGQGLKARFRDLVESAQSEQDREFYSRKGREYFEKIIQFGVPVPEPGPNEGYRFIGAHFPQWAASADLVIAALGANPRRLKQYMGLLEYRYGVATSMPESGGVPARSTPTADLRNRLTAIWWRDRKVGDRLAELASTPGFALQLDNLRSGLAHGPADLQERVTRNALVRELLPPGQSLSKHGAVVPATILRFADLRPATDGALVTRDAPFLRIVGPPLLGLPITVDGIIAQDVDRLAKLDSAAAVVIAELIEIANEADYVVKVEEIERTVGDTDAWSPSARTYFTDPTMSADDLARRRALLTAEPRLSTIARQVVQAYGNQRTIVATTLSAFEPGDEAEGATAVRVEAAEDYAARRRFAKADILIHLWRDLGAYLNYDRPRLIAIEQDVRAPLLPDDVRARFIHEYANGERLLRFLRLRPYFDELYPAEVKRASVVAQPLASTAPTPQPALRSVAAATASQPAPDPTPVPETQPPTPNTSFEQAPALERSIEDAYTMFLRMETTPVTRLFKATMWDKSGAVASWTTEVDERATLDFRRSEVTDTDLRGAGRRLFETAFSTEIATRIRTLLRTRLRLVVDVTSGADAISRLPWEALSADSSAPAAEGRLQVIRYLRLNDDTRIPTGDDAMRMLAVIPSLKDLGPFAETEARAALERVLAPASERGMLRYDILAGEVTREKLHEWTNQARPNIFHFFGHARVDVSSEEGGILLGPGRGDYVGAGAVTRFFVDTGAVPRLAVLVGVQTGSGGEKGVQNSVAGRLVLAGVPVVIATVRVITVQSALLFSQRFYSALLEDGDAEQALAEARKALEREKWDWGAFAMFSNQTATPRLPFRPSPMA